VIGRKGTFDSLSVRNFRRFFVGQSVSATGTWMQKVAQPWLVLELTGSATLLGVTAALQQLPTLVVGPWAGLLADRVDKRRLLLVTKTIAGLLAALLGVLTLTGRIEYPMVLAIALAHGLVDALDRPARQAFVSEMVGRDHLANALMLNGVVNNGARMVGPAVAGVVIALIGLPGGFLVNAASYLALVAALLVMRVSELYPSKPIQRRRGQLREGLVAVRRDPGLAGPLVVMTVSGLFAFEFAVTIPLMASQVFDGDAATFGAMFSAMGVGAVAGGLFVAGSLRPTFGAIVRTACIFGGLLLAFAFAPSFVTALGVLVFLGAARIGLKVLVNAFLQMRAAPAMRGRVLGLFAVSTAGTTPIGAPLVGWIADVHGVRTAVALGGVATVVVAVSVVRLARRIDACQASSDAGAQGPASAD
jgi:MFS family permease